MQRVLFDWNRGTDDAIAPPSSAAPDSQADPPTIRGAWIPFGRRIGPVQVVDETLRDGLQSVSGVDPPISHKIDLLHAMARIGVDVVSVGLPATGPRQLDDARLLCREITAARLPLRATAAARTLTADVEAIAEVAEKSGLPVEVYGFIGSSPIRHFAEGWDLDFLTRTVRGAAETAARASLPFCLVTEDATRSHPDTLGALIRAAVEAGARRVCLCDTTGHATPYGVGALIRFVLRELAALGAHGVGLDWHAHNDRGLGLATALWAVSNGVDRVHGTGLGVGERVGNTSLELLVDNLGRIGARPAVPRERLEEYCLLAARALSRDVPSDHPIAGDRYVEEQRGDRSYRLVRADDEVAEPADRLIPMSLRLNGADVPLAVPPRRTLLEALRYDLDLVGTKQGCDKGDCGACTVLVDGRAVLACLTLALEADGREVTTVEALAGAPHMDPLLDCFDRVGGGQCGFCTPGMLMSATALLRASPRPTRDEIKRAISGNLCRCTGYGTIVDAIDLAAKILRGEAQAEGAARRPAAPDVPPGMKLPGTECPPPPLPPHEEPRAEPRGTSSAPPPPWTPPPPTNGGTR